MSAEPAADSCGPAAAGWFNPIATFLGRSYWAPNTTRIQAFTAGTAQEVAFLIEALGLVPGARVLDLGCGPGRHSLALAQAGMHVVGVDLAESFVELAREYAVELGVADRCEFIVGDVRTIEFHDEFDALICLCQGGFGLLGGNEDAELLSRFAAALRPGAPLAISAFHGYFAVRYLEAGDQFDAATGVNHEVAALVNGSGATTEHDLWTTCFTARELTTMARAAGLAEVDVFGVTPGDYGRRPAAVDRPELLVLARRSGQA